MRRRGRGGRISGGFIRDVNPTINPALTSRDGHKSYHFLFAVISIITRQTGQLVKPGFTAIYVDFLRRAADLLRFLQDLLEGKPDISGGGSGDA